VRAQLRRPRDLIKAERAQHRPSENQVDVQLDRRGDIQASAGGGCASSNHSGVGRSAGDVPGVLSQPGDPSARHHHYPARPTHV
jgi:hypothetical protein